METKENGISEVLYGEILKWIKMLSYTGKIVLSLAIHNSLMDETDKDIFTEAEKGDVPSQDMDEYVYEKLRSFAEKVYKEAFRTGDSFKLLMMHMSTVSIMCYDNLLKEAEKKLDEKEKE